MGKYIIFQAEPDTEGWEHRKLEHTQALTRILAEHRSYSNKPIPEPGYRPTEFIRVDALHDPNQHAHSTHYRDSDWEVTRVETYTLDLPTGKYDMIVICYCQYNPINAPLHPMPERQVSVDSFGGDEAAYKEWQMAQKHPAEV
jgi:hypothetical protein